MTDLIHTAKTKPTMAKLSPLPFLQSMETQKSWAGQRRAGPVLVVQGLGLELRELNSFALKSNRNLQYRHLKREGRRGRERDPRNTL